MMEDFVFPFAEELNLPDVSPEILPFEYFSSLVSFEKEFREFVHNPVDELDNNLLNNLKIQIFASKITAKM